MLGSDFFDAEHHPELRFSSTALELCEDGNDARLTAGLSLLAEMELPVPQD